jgi:hypothetical protein
VLRETVDELTYIWRRRSTFRGLLLLLLLVNLIVIPAAVSSSYFTLDRLGVLQEPSRFLKFVAFAAAGVAVVNLTALLAWIKWRRIPSRQIGRAAILFAPRPASDSEDLLYSLYDQFKADLAAHGLSGLVSHALVPSDRPVFDHNDAIKLIAETGANVVIFGSLTRGQIAGKTVEGFDSISFTLNHPPLGSGELGSLTETLAGALALRNYAVSNENSFIERNVVVKNLSEVARFFIAVGLTLERKLGTAIPLLEQLLAEGEIKVAGPSTTPQLEFFRRAIRRALHAALLAQFNVVYETKLLPHIGLRNGDSAAAECAHIVDRLESISGQIDRYALTRAIFSFHFGRLAEARALALQSKRGIPPNDPSPSISLAFLSLWEGKYGDALKHYLRAKRGDIWDFNMITNVLGFLEGVIENNPEKQQLRFGLAFLNDAFFDPAVAEKEYAEFLRLTEGKTELKILRNQASSRLRAIGAAARKTTS